MVVVANPVNNQHHPEQVREPVSSAWM